MVLKRKKPYFETSALTQELITRMLNTKPGDFLSYKELSRIIKKDVQNEGRHHLSSAMRNCMRKPHEIVFGCVFGEGIQHLTQKEIASLGSVGLKRTCRMAKRWKKKLECVKDVSILTSEEARKFQMQSLMLASLEMNSSVNHQLVVDKRIQQGMPLQIAIQSLNGF